MLYRAARYQAGIIDIDGDRPTFVALGDDGAELHREVLTAAARTPR